MELLISTVSVLLYDKRIDEVSSIEYMDRVSSAMTSSFDRTGRVLVSKLLLIAFETHSLSARRRQSGTGGTKGGVRVRRLHG